MRHTHASHQNLSDEQRADLKRKMSRAREIEGIESRLKYIAFDVGQHFATNFQGTGLKGQLAAPSKRAAIQLKKLFDEFGVVTTEVVISAPEMRESDDEVDEADDDLVRTFWRKMLERHGGEDAYNKSVVEQFKGAGRSGNHHRRIRPCGVMFPERHTSFSDANIGCKSKEPTRRMCDATAAG